MHCSSVAAVLQSLHQASEADESTPNFIEADPQKERHMNQSNMGQNNIFSKKERDSLYFIEDSRSDSSSDKKNYNSSFNESKHRLSSKMSRKSRDHHRQSRGHRRQRSETSYQQSARQSSPDYTVNARFRRRTKRDSSDSSTTESKDRRSSKMSRRSRDHHRQRVQVRRLSPSPNFRSVHAKRITKKRKIDSDLAIYLFKWR